MRSDKPEAKPFQDWVTSVVLPAIRKDGMYVAGEDGFTPLQKYQLNQMVGINRHP
ncbi:MAG: hypothetical protein FD119_2819 [Stygiobacter sp.]|nr:MAG: hypothetical protein FD119_2819 [Stygiobacter sp.]